MRKLISELAPSLTHTCESYRLILGKNLTNILAPAVKDVILMAQDYILRVREILTEFWLAVAEGVDGCWEMKI